MAARLMGILVPVVVSESFTLMGLVMSTVWSESLLQAVTSRPRVAAMSSVWILLVFIFGLFICC